MSGIGPTDVYEPIITTTDPPVVPGRQNQSLWIPHKFFRSFWSLLSNQSGKYSFRHNIQKKLAVKKCKILEVLQSYMVADPEEGLFSILKLCRMFRIFRIAKVSRPRDPKAIDDGPSLTFIIRYTSGLFPITASLKIIRDANGPRIPDWHNENLRIMIRTILASTGELCFMLTLLRIRDPRTVKLIDPNWVRSKSVDLCLGLFLFYFDKMVRK